MKRLLALTTGILALCATVPAHSYSYNVCNGYPSRIKNASMSFQFDSTCSMPYGSSKESAALAAMAEWNNVIVGIYNQGSPSPPGCYWRSGDGINEVATAASSQIGGLLGETFTKTTGCNFWYDVNNIIEADVIVSTGLDYGWPDESMVGANFHCQTAGLSQQNGTCDIGLGNFVFHHEMGHALGLNHSPGQCIMHNGPPVPYGGGGWSAGDSAIPFPDDSAGTRAMYNYTGNATSFRNVFPSSSHEPSPSSDALAPNTTYPIEPAGWGAIYYGCPGNWLPLYNTFANNGTTNESFDQRIYVNNCPGCVNGGWDVGYWYGSYAPSLSLGTSSNTWSIPGGSVPRGQYLWVYHRVDSSNQIPAGAWGARTWDNVTHYPFILVVNSGC